MTGYKATTHCVVSVFCVSGAAKMTQIFGDDGLNGVVSISFFPLRAEVIDIDTEWG